MGIRIPLFPLPFQGHITPMFHLAEILRSEGFSITIIQTKYKSVDPNHFPHFSFHFLDDGLPEIVTSAIRNISTILDTLNRNCLEPFRNCVSQILRKGATSHQVPIACLIADPMWSFAGPVAKSVSLPRIVLGCASMSAFYVYHSLPSLHKQGYYPLQGSLLFYQLLDYLVSNTQKLSETKFDKPVPELPPLKVKDLPSEAECNLLINMFKEIETSQGIISNTFRELEDSYITRIQHALPIPIFPLGPIHKNAPSFQVSIWTQDNTSISWLNTQEPKSVLYVSFGSIAAISKADFLEIAYGLAKSKQPFLWVIRNGLIEGSEENDPPTLPEGYIDMVDQRANIIKWAPQQQVLYHPAIGGFWTHCGWNSIIESISEGVPMLCQPCFADQTMNMRHVSDSWKIGLQLEKGKNRREIERAIRKLMVGEEGEAMRKRITTLKEKSTLSFMENGSSYESLKNLTSYLLSF